MKILDLPSLFIKSLSGYYKTNQSIIDETYHKILSNYTEKHRSYHNIEHIQSVLKYILQECPQSSNLILACFFHDFIYNPDSKTNEEDSANECKLFLEKINFTIKDIEQIYRLILSTKDHIPIDDSFESQFFLDSDLSILGSDTEIYQNYSKQIRLEYIHIEDSIYQKERSKILKTLLERNSIYYTDIMKNSLEQKARENLNQEILSYSVNNK